MTILEFEKMGGRLFRIGKSMESRVLDACLGDGEFQDATILEAGTEDGVFRFGNDGSRVPLNQFGLVYFGEDAGTLE